MSKENTLDKFFEGEAKRVESERKEAMKERGFNEFYKIPKGETKLTVLYAQPRIAKGNFGDQRVFKVRVDKVEYDLALSEKSPLYRFFITNLARSKKDLNVSITRVGDGKNTRYDAELL